VAADASTPLRLVSLTMPERALLVAMTKDDDVSLAGHKLHAMDVLVAVGVAERCDRGSVKRGRITARGRAWLTRWDSADRRLLEGIESVVAELRARRARGEL
jgi:hypothetical protein